MDTPQPELEGKFSLGHERSEPDPPPSTVEEPNPPQQKRQRVNLLSILISMLLIVVLAIVYLDIKRSVSSLSVSGSQSIQELAADLQSRFSSLSIQYAKLEEESGKRSRALEERLKQKTDALEKGAAAMKASLSATEEALKTLGSAKLNADEFRKASAAAEKSIKSIQELSATGLAKIGVIEADQRKFSGDIQQSAQVLQKEIGQLRKDLTALQGTKVDRETLSSTLTGQKENYQQMLNLLTRKLEGRIEALEGRLDQMERSARSVRPSPRSPLPLAPSGSADLPPSRPLEPARRGIMEQNIPD